VPFGARGCAFRRWEPQLPQLSKEFVASPKHGLTLLLRQVHVHRYFRRAPTNPQTSEEVAAPADLPSARPGERIVRRVTR
jgi:hypothetical protein